MKLKKIVKEIESTGEKYRKSKDKLIRDSYNQYIELLIINEAEKSQQYNLCDYWERLIR